MENKYFVVWTEGDEFGVELKGVSASVAISAVDACNAASMTEHHIALHNPEGDSWNLRWSFLNYLQVAELRRLVSEGAA